MAKIISLVLLSVLLACFIALGTAQTGQQGQEQQWNDNPYTFDDRHFITGLQSPHGQVRVLPKFTQKSPVLRGIENYRVVIFEAEPQTFVLPNHYDADAIFFVTNGRGTVSIAKQNERESFSIKQGDVVRVKAGASVYMVNHDNNQKLVLAKLIIPLDIPGEFQGFFGAGGGIEESYWPVFSNDILQAALNTRIDRIQRVIGQRRDGFIVKASEQQIRELSREEQGGIWPFQRSESSPYTFNLFEARPIYSNQFGQLYEVDANKFMQLREHNVQVSLANITRRAMTTLHYNSKATKIIVVVSGFGFSEMAVPSLQGSQGWQPGQQQGQQGSQGWQPGKQQGQQGSQGWQPGQQQGQQGSQGWQPGQQQGQQGSQGWQPGQQQGQQGGQQGSQGQQQSGPRYQRISSFLKPGTVLIVPAGHPYVVGASDNHNLQLLSFEVNAQGNQMFNLAGRRNVISQLEREAKALSFGVPVELVDEVFGNWNEGLFGPGPRWQSQGRADA